MQRRRKVIFDTDPSPDDAVAFLSAIASREELEVLAITTVAGNVPVELTTCNALKALELAGVTEVPVYAGASEPLVRRLVTAEHVHGRTGFDGYDLPTPKRQAGTKFAPDAIVELVMAQPAGSVTLCCLAPLTNVALALAREPKLAEHLEEIVLMGGSCFEGGNITAAAEFNFFVDPEAAARVFRSGVPITMIPLDCTHQALLTEERLRVLREAGTPVGTAFYHLLEFNKRFDRGKYGWEGGPLHDATVTAFLLQPELFAGRRVHVGIECASTLTLGASVVDWWSVSGQQANATVLRSVDGEGYIQLIFERLLRL
ncbi:MAG: nucleoside hydrolase [Acidobacteriaceae bacterium]|nr:nucleoside hydrolase [Acidobacteriaceae bacterium]